MGRLSLLKNSPRSVNAFRFLLSDKRRMRSRLRRRCLVHACVNPPFADIRRQFRLRRNRPNQRGVGRLPLLGEVARSAGGVDRQTGASDWREATFALRLKRSAIRDKSAKGGVGGKTSVFPPQFLKLIAIYIFSTKLNPEPSDSGLNYS